MNKLIISFAFAVLAGVLFTSQIFASGESNCQTIYGGGQTCNSGVKFTLNKLVQVPGKGGGNYVDNLTVSDAKYTAGQTVNFKIVVTNTGTTTLNNVAVVDTFPQFINFTAGAGNYNSGNKQLAFTIPSLATGASQEFIVSGKVVDEGQLPTTAGITCVTNTAHAGDTSGSVADDMSQVCIQKNVFGAPTPEVFQKVPVNQIPATGPELYSLIGLIPTGIAGIMLRKKSNR